MASLVSVILFTVAAASTWITPCPRWLALAFTALDLYAIALLIAT